MAAAWAAAGFRVEARYAEVVAHVVWQPPGGAAACVAAACKAQLAFAWQACYTEPLGGAAARVAAAWAAAADFRVAGALLNSKPLGGAAARVAAAWAAAGFVWQARYTEPSRVAFVWQAR